MSGEPHIRKVGRDELEEVWRVYVASSSDGAARRGQPATLRALNSRQQTVSDSRQLPLPLSHEA